VVRQLAILVQPAMPASAAKLLELLAQPEARRTFAHLGQDGRLSPGTRLPPPVGVFPRYVRPAEDDAEAVKPAKPAKQGKTKDKGKEDTV
jgi:methionyl-tRNA synthetase